MIFVKYLEELNKWYHNIHTDKDWANISIIANIEKNLGLTFVPASFDSVPSSIGNVCMAGSPEIRNDYKEIFTPINLLDYIYAVLHSSNYREKYKEYWKVDFSRVPNPKDLQSFWALVVLGDRLRQLQQSETNQLIAEIDGIEFE